MRCERALDLKNLGEGKAQVAIIAPKTTLAPNEPVTLLGMSAFGDNAHEFIIGTGENKIIEPSKFYVFRSENIGRHKVIFRAKNNQDKWIQSQLTLKVIKVKQEKKPCKKI